MPAAIVAIACGIALFALAVTGAYTWLCVIQEEMDQRL
mgnify:CR=1 FL=1